MEIVEKFKEDLAKRQQAKEQEADEAKVTRVKLFVLA